jgi:hypothetical protein
MARKAREILHRLYIDKSAFDAANLNDGICFKPKNMHWKKFHRLRRADSEEGNAGDGTIEDSRLVPFNDSKIVYEEEYKTGVTIRAFFTH